MCTKLFKMSNTFFYIRYRLSWFLYKFSISKEKTIFKKFIKLKATPLAAKYGTPFPIVLNLADKDKSFGSSNSAGKEVRIFALSVMLVFPLKGLFALL